MSWLKDKLFIAFGFCFLVAWILYHWATEPVKVFFCGKRTVDFVHNPDLKPRP